MCLLKNKVGAEHDRWTILFELAIGETSLPRSSCNSDMNASELLDRREEILCTDSSLSLSELISVFKGLIKKIWLNESKHIHQKAF